jgi:hypothetical protein
MKQMENPEKTIWLKGSADKKSGTKLELVPF